MSNDMSYYNGNENGGYSNYEQNQWQNQYQSNNQEQGSSWYDDGTGYGSYGADA